MSDADAGADADAQCEPAPRTMDYVESPDDIPGIQLSLLRILKNQTP